MDVTLGGTARGPLAGLRVLDVSTVVSGPLCTQVLGDLGADVWKVEGPRGDSTRMMGPPFRGGYTPIFAQFNRNKRSVVVDLKRPEGLAVVRRLAARADVLVENFRPGVMDRLGLGYDALAADNPGLVFVSINGFGSDGPYRDLPAYDGVIQGLVGFATVQGGAGAPALVRCIAADKTTGTTAVYATLAALFARERNGGRGQHVEIPMLNAYAAFMLPDVLGPATFVTTDAGPTFDMGRVHRAWPTADGHVVMMIVEDHHFAGMCRAVEREDLIADERFSTLMGRAGNLDALLTLAEQEIRRWPTAELVERARRFGAPIAPVNDLAAFLADPQVAAGGAVVPVEDAQAGPMRFLGNPVRFPDTPTSFRRLPPRLGEHTDEVLGEAGFGAEEIAGLRAAAAVY
jgi:crotonobetainyl-CoA:carnitine CoA-transferase CaiB-like acyl-CoA transferase